MTATTTTTTTYRKTKTGEWVVFGPADLVQVGSVLVTKRDGSTKTEQIARVGKTFQANGIEACYGYIAARRTAGGHRKGRGECYECGTWGPVGQRCHECHEGSHVA